MARTLYDKLWDSHVVREEADGTALLYIDRHLVHEVTSPQAYEGLEEAGRKVWRVDSVVAKKSARWALGVKFVSIFLEWRCRRGELPVV